MADDGFGTVQNKGQVSIRLSKINFSLFYVTTNSFNIREVITELNKNPNVKS